MLIKSPQMALFKPAKLIPIAELFRILIVPTTSNVEKDANRRYVYWSNQVFYTLIPTFVYQSKRQAQARHCSLDWVLCLLQSKSCGKSIGCSGFSAALGAVSTWQLMQLFCFFVTLEPIIWLTWSPHPYCLTLKPIILKDWYQKLRMRLALRKKGEMTGRLVCIVFV